MDKCIKLSGGHSGEAIPVPIPNTEVKLSYADDTDPCRERRLLPDFFIFKQYKGIRENMLERDVDGFIIGKLPESAKPYKNLSYLVVPEAGGLSEYTAGCVQ